MDFTPDQHRRYDAIYNAPTDANIRVLLPFEFSKFIAYLYQRDTVYTPVFVDGTGDGGVDIELRARNESEPTLQGLVQCKRYEQQKISAKDMREFVEVGRRAGVTRLSYFTTSDYANPAYVEARDHQVTTFRVEDIQTWIQEIHRRQRFSTTVDAIYQPGDLPIPVIALSNHKGGVGKTTTTVALASHFADQGKGVLIIDGDPQCNLTQWVTNQHKFGERESLHAVFMRRYPLHPLMKPTVLQNVWVVPACQPMENLHREPDEYHLQRRLSYEIAVLPLRDPQIDIILIDTPPALQILTQAALIASSQLLIPLQYDTLSADGIHPLLTMVMEMEALHQRRKLQILGGVGVRINTRTNETNIKYRKSIEATASAHPRLTSSPAKKFWCTELSNLASYPDAANQRQFYTQVRPRPLKALREINLLAKEIEKRVNAHVFPHV